MYDKTMASRMVTSVGQGEENASPTGVVYNRQPDQPRQHDEQSVLQVGQEKKGGGERWMI